MSWTSSQKGREWLLLVLLLVPLAALRFSLHSGEGPYGVDGSYYVQIARNLLEGQGFVTSVCIYHQGLDPLPAPTNIYPLWPALLAASGFVIGWEDAIRHVPRVLYLVVLVILFSLARRIAPERQSVAGPLTIAHIAVVLFGLTPIFFSSTTYPYTEGLAFAFGTAALVMSFKTGARWAFAGGLLAGLATLSRSQMLLLVFGILAARLVSALREKEWKALLLSISGVAIVLVPWLYYVSTFTGSFALRNLSASYHQTPEVTPYALGLHAATFSEAMALRFRGAMIAFNPFSSDSFVALFGAAALLVPLAAAHWLLRVWRERPSLSQGVLAVALSGAFLSLILIHLPQRYFRAWLFGWRHGLPLIFLIILALVELIGFGHRYVRWATLALVLLSVLWGGTAVMRTVIAGPPMGPSPAERDLSGWLDRQPRSTVVLTTNAQVLSTYSRANFRWAACDTPVATTRALLTRVRTDYVAIYEAERGCGFVSGIEDLVEPVAAFGAEPRRILLLRTRTVATGP
ncbi:MAG TPA: hypothetical protein VF701_09395 [Thermoanaerobaculia bacterium]